MEHSRSLDEHRHYLERLQGTSRAQAVLGCFDDEPFAYFEIYWAKEDRIAPYYDAGDYDADWVAVVGC